MRNSPLPGIWRAGRGLRVTRPRGPWQEGVAEITSTSSTINKKRALPKERPQFLSQILPYQPTVTSVKDTVEVLLKTPSRRISLAAT